MRIPPTWLATVFTAALLKGNYFATSEAEPLEILIIVALATVIVWDAIKTYLDLEVRP